MALYLEQISANRYAPQGSDPVYLYANGLEGGQHLTLAQLVIAVSMRSAAAYEAQSVVKMNRMADGADQLEKVAEFMELIANGDGDWPTIKAYCQSELGITETLPDAIDTYAKRMTAMAFYKLQNSMGVESVYNHADFRLMSKRALDMLADYKETNLYLRGLIPQIGLRSTTVDDVISERYAGASKYTLKKMLRLAFNGITAFSVKPMHAIFFLGVLFLIVAFFIGLYVIHALITRSAVPGWSSLILSVWLVGGFIILSIGIAGLYIGNIYNEVKHRPLYHIQEILD